ncbi:hypothetical protein K8T06_05950 [bacterium]|nr:hypothetical protein [bacterium]
MTPEQIIRTHFKTLFRKIFFLLAITVTLPCFSLVRFDRMSDIQGIDHYIFDHSRIIWTQQVIPELAWPSNMRTGTGIFYGVLLDPSFTRIIGTTDIWVFRWQ